MQRRDPDVTQDDLHHRRDNGHQRRSSTLQHRGVCPLGWPRLGRWPLRLRQRRCRPRWWMGMARWRLGLAWRSCSRVGLAWSRMGLARCWVGLGRMGMGRCRPLRGRDSGRVQLLAMGADRLGLGAGLGLLRRAGACFSEVGCGSPTLSTCHDANSPFRCRSRARSRAHSDRPCPARWRLPWRLHLAGARTALEKFLAPRLRGGANRPASGDCSYADNNLQADSGGWAVTIRRRRSLN